MARKAPIALGQGQVQCVPLQLLRPHHRVRNCVTSRKSAESRTAQHLLHVLAEGGLFAPPGVRPCAFATSATSSSLARQSVWDLAALPARVRAAMIRLPTAIQPTMV